MNGQKGLTIVVIALLLTVCIGFLFNAEQQPTAKTVYEERADLAPIFAMDSSRENVAELYNSKFNITGWTPNTMVDTQATANEYIMTPQSSNIENYTKTIDLNGLGLLTTTRGIDNGNKYITADNGARWYGNSPSLNNGGQLYGGQLGASTVDGQTVSFNIDFNGSGHSLQLNTFIAYVPFSAFWNDPINNARVDIDEFETANYSEGTSNALARIYYNYSFTANDFVMYVNASLAPAGSYMIYNAPSHTWTLYASDTSVIASNIQPILGRSIILPIPAPNELKTVTIPYSAPEITAATYANPTKLVNLTNNPANTPIENLPRWSNYEYNITFVNESISLLVNGATTIYTPDPVIITVDSNGIYSVNGTATGAYTGGLYLTLNTKSKTIEVKGVTYANPDAPGTDYTLTAFAYNVAWTTAPDNLKVLYFQTETNAKARIVDTWVYTDPNNKLWINPNVNLGQYFSEALSNNARVIFNGFVAYGSSITINGHTYNVTDGKITVPVEMGGNLNPEDREVKLSGLSVEYYNGNCYLIATEDGNAKADLGAIVNYVIAGVGAWYFDAHIQDIKTSSVLSWEWFSGWTLSVNQTALVFIGLTIAGLLIGLRFGRGTLEFTDYVIMAIAAFAAFSLMVV